MSAFLQKQEDKIYRHYISDALYCIAKNTAKEVGGVSLTKQLRDITESDNEPEKSGDEIALDVINRLGLKV